VADGLEICKACGYDFTDRSGHKGKALSGGWIVPAIVVLCVALVIVVVWSVKNRKPATEVNTWPMRHAERATRDSVPARDERHDARGEKSPRQPSGNRPDEPGKARAALGEYNKKIDDLQQHAEATRKHLKDGGRLTPQADAILNQIIAKCGEARGGLGSLGGNPTPEMRKAASAVMDGKLAEIRKMFGQVKQ
jgi:hypothetical protein